MTTDRSKSFGVDQEGASLRSANQQQEPKPAHPDSLPPTLEEYEELKRHPNFPAFKARLDAVRKGMVVCPHCEGFGIVRGEK